MHCEILEGQLGIGRKHDLLSFLPTTSGEAAKDFHSVNTDLLLVPAKGLFVHYDGVLHRKRAAIGLRARERGGSAPTPSFFCLKLSDLLPFLQQMHERHFIFSADQETSSPDSICLW